MHVVRVLRDSRRVVRWFGKVAQMEEEGGGCV